MARLIAGLAYPDLALPDEPVAPASARLAILARTFLAAALALYIGFAMDLRAPLLALATAYITSQPLSGRPGRKRSIASWARWSARLAAVAMVPNLVNAPVLLSLAFTVWVGFCLYFALRDRTPRSYLFMLAGYTAAIIGFPSVAAPGHHLRRRAGPGRGIHPGHPLRDGGVIRDLPCPGRSRVGDARLGMDWQCPPLGAGGIVRRPRD